MRIEKLNENKIRIFLGIEDLREKNIDLHDFMSNSLESQDLFLDLLTKAEAEVGFKTHNYKLLIEALASSDGNFIFTITRTKPEGSQKLKENKPKVKRYTTTPNKALSIYSFNTFDEFCEFCNYIQTSNLILINLRLNVTDLKSFSYTISEFSSRVKNEELLERKLKEYGKVIISKNAIATCLKYFK